MKEKGFIATLLENERETDNSILTNNEQVFDKCRVHWWIFVVPTAIIIIGIYLWLKAITKGSFNLLALLDFPSTNPKYIPESIYSYILIGLEYVNKYMPESVYNFLNTTYLHPRKWISQIVLLYGFYKLIRAAFTFISTEITLTSTRVLIKSGVIKPQYIDIPREHLTVFNYKRGILGRFFNVGTLIIQSTGGFICSIPAIQFAMNIRREMLATEETN